jgi:hypothetical protein
MFFCMAQAVCCCLASTSKWRDNYLVAVLDQMFLTPRPWPLENIAGFLLFCSESVREAQKLSWGFVQTRALYKQSIKFVGRNHFRLGFVERIVPEIS